jgi:pantetheine-phosphate adenylyltransferase
MTTALYPGSFDPPTNGHVDVVGRCAAVFDRLVVAVVTNPSKDPMFDHAERIGLLEAVCAEFDNVDVMGFDGLLVDFAEEHGIDALVKGLRAVSDFDYEMQMAQMNHSLRGAVTLFIPTAPQWSYLSSSLVREVARLGGDVSALVPEEVAEALKEKM